MALTGNFSNTSMTQYFIKYILFDILNPKMNSFLTSLI